MKKILNEWRNYLNESPNTIASRLKKLTKKLERSNKEIDVFKLAAIRIVLFLSGEGDHLCRYVKLHPVILINHCDRLLGKHIPDFDALGNSHDQYFHISEAVVGTSPSEPKIRLSASPFEDLNVIFDDQEDMQFKIQILRNMIENEDCDFKIFYQDPWAISQRYNKDRKFRGAGYGQAGFTIPPGMSDAETDEFVKNFEKYNEYSRYVIDTLRPADLSAIMMTKETDPRDPIDIKKNLLKPKITLFHDRTPKPMSWKAPLPDDYYDKMAEYMSKMPPVFGYLANAWERSLSRITDRLSMKHAQREVRSAREAAKHFESAARALKSEISDPVQKIDKYINRNLYGIQRVAAYIIYLDNKIKAEGKKPDKHLVARLSQEIRESFKLIKRMEEEIKQYQSQKPGAVSLEGLIAQARSGNKEAAKQAREIAFKEKEELEKYTDPKDKERIKELTNIAREMRRLSR